jgi:ketosteroid isomerase-like protein
MKSLFSKSILILSCLLLINSSVFSQDTDLKAKMQEMNNTMVKAMLADDMETSLSFYADDAISLPSYEPMIKGKAAIKEHAKKSHEAGFKMNDMTLNTMDAWSDGGLAFEIGTYTVSMTMPGMPDAVNDKGKYLTVWQKQTDGSWKIKAETWNSDNNPWQSMGMNEKKMEHEAD